MNTLNKKGKISLYLHMLRTSDRRLMELDIINAEIHVQKYYDRWGEGKVDINGCHNPFILKNKYIKGAS